MSTATGARSMDLRALRTELQTLINRYSTLNRGGVREDVLARALAADVAQCLKEFDKKQRIGDPYRVPGPSPE